MKTLGRYQNLPHSLLRISIILDCFNQMYSKILPWLIILMMILTASVIILRYVFASDTVIFWQECLTYTHATLLMMSFPYVLKIDGHVRIDILYRHFSTTTKAWINSLGIIVLALPLIYLLTVDSWKFATDAWSIKEISSEPNGIPAVYLLKSVIPLALLLLFLQCLAELSRNMSTLIKE